MPGTRKAMKKFSSLWGIELTMTCSWGHPWTMVATMVWPWLPMSGSCSLIFPVTSSWILLDGGIGYGLSVLVIIGPLVLYPLIHKASKILLAPSCFRFTRSKSTNTSKTSKTKHNSRNKGTNHTIKHTNLLK